MIDLLFQNVISNTNKIDSISKYINKTNMRNTILTGLIIINVYAIVKTVQKHDKRISEIESKMMDNNSKGE